MQQQRFKIADENDAGGTILGEGNFNTLFQN